MKNLSMVVLCLAISSQANAGIWDSITGLFGSSDNAEPVAAAPAGSSDVAAKSDTSSMIATGMQLLPMLTQGLNISDSKALGGMGALLQAVQGIMSDGDYSSLLSAIPNASSFLDAVPQLDAIKEDGALGDVMSAAGELSGKAKSLSALTSQFDSLGLDMDMAPQFAGVAQKYLTESGNDSANELLGSAISQLF